MIQDISAGMMRLHDKLQCPVTGVPLKLNADGSWLRTESTQYGKSEGVWQLLPQNQLSNYYAHYEKDAEVFDYFEATENPATIHEHRRLQESIIRQIPKISGAVLDVGCGNGWLAAYLIQHRPNVEVCSMDLSTSNTTNTRKRVRSERHLVIRADALHLPFKDESFDVLVASEILEHVEQVPAFLKELYRVLKPAGRLIMTTPYNEVIQYSLCIHCNRKTPLHAHLHSVNEQFILNQVILSGINGKVSTHPFLNKLLVMLKTHVVLKFLPYRWWKGLDWLANKAIGHQSRLLIVIDKLPLKSF